MAYFSTPLVTPEMYARGQFFTKRSVTQKLILREKSRGVSCSRNVREMRRR